MEQGGGHNENDEGIEKSLRKMKQDTEQREGKGCSVVLRTHLSQKASICCSPSLDGFTDQVLSSIRFVICICYSFTRESGKFSTNGY